MVLYHAVYLNNEFHSLFFPFLFRASRSLHALADAGVVLRVGSAHKCHVAARDVFPQRRVLPKHAAHGRRVRRLPQRHDPHAVHAVRLVLRAAEREPAAAPPTAATAATTTGAILLEPVPDVIVQRDSLARVPKTHLTTQNREGKRTFNND